MTALNVVGMTMKPGRQEKATGAWADLHPLRVVKAGEREYLVVGEWESTGTLTAAPPATIPDRFRASRTWGAGSG